MLENGRSFQTLTASNRVFTYMGIPPPDARDVLQCTAWPLAAPPASAYNLLVAPLPRVMIISNVSDTAEGPQMAKSPCWAGCRSHARPPPAMPLAPRFHGNVSRHF